MRLNLSVRSCDDSACSGESFAQDLTNATKSSLSVTNNRYFQYQANFLKDNVTGNVTFSPELYNVTIHYSNFTPSCNCPSSGNWNVLGSDNCLVTTNCNLQGNNITIAGTGTFEVNAYIFNFKKLAVHGTTVVCRRAAGCFG